MEQPGPRGIGIGCPVPGSRLEQVHTRQDSVIVLIRWQLPYAFPPFKLVGAVLAKARQDKVDRMLLVVPWHHSKTWFPMLLEMLVEARRLCQFPRLVVDLATEKAPPDVSRCRLVTCVISGKPGSTERPSSSQGLPGVSSR